MSTDARVDRFSVQVQYDEIKCNPKIAVGRWIAIAAVLASGGKWNA